METSQEPSKVDVMASIYDAIKKKQQERQKPTVEGGATAGAQRLLQAKTGKAGGQQQPLSTETEAVEIQQVAGQQEDIQRQADVATAGQDLQQAGQQQQFEQKMDMTALGRAATEEEKQQQLMNIEQQVSIAADKVGLQQDELAMNARVFGNRMQAQEYIDTLKRDKTLERAFKSSDAAVELANMQWDYKTQSVLTDEKYQDIFAKEDVDYKSAYAQMDSDSILKMAEAFEKAKIKGAWIEGITSGTQMGMKAGA